MYDADLCFTWIKLLLKIFFPHILISMEFYDPLDFDLLTAIYKEIKATTVCKYDFLILKYEIYGKVLFTRIRKSSKYAYSVHTVFLRGR